MLNIADSKIDGGGNVHIRSVGFGIVGWGFMTVMVLLLLYIFGFHYGRHRPKRK